MYNLFSTVLAVFGLLAGVIIGYFVRKQIAKNQADSIEAKAEKIIAETKVKQQDMLFRAKEKSLEMMDESKREDENRRKELRVIQQRLEKRETLFDQKLLELQDKQQKIQEKVEKITQIQAEVQALREEEIVKLQKISNLTREEAKDELFKKVEVQIKDDLMGRIMKLEQESSEAFEQKAREIIVDSIQRYAAAQSAETTSTVVDLPNDEMKGRIIGKEGRNIKTLEKLTGCELIIDDTPNAITVSGFSPIRRQVAALALRKLISDGRIQPARIEEFVESAKIELSTDIRKTGEAAVYQLGFTGLDPKFVQIIGRLKYRTSYGQNILNHSLEVAYLSAMIAEELGADPIVAKKAGFFHDIGKAIDHETQGGHPEIGYQILKKFNFDEEIAYAALGHHEDKPKTLITCIVKAADAISGSRIGARKDTYEQYIHRLEELEKTASVFPGIEKVYAIQAGREVRVFVKPEEMDDNQSYALAREVAKKIEAELQYPGEIKVTVIREKRIIEYAK
ncbi:MAG: ribonuclease Y [Candidatus Magasanikbacteria bacterium]|nr:ribonuclease Y [Candidatus Magasanikbacteria bacterium]